MSITAVQNEHWAFYCTLDAHYSTHFPTYKDMLSKLTACIAQLNACNQQYAQMKSYAIEQMAEDRQTHLKVQETFGQGLIHLEAFSSKMHSMIIHLQPHHLDPEELYRDKETTFLAAARITASISEVQAKLQQGVQFYVEQSDALFKTVTHAKTLYRLNACSWWVPIKENDENAALAKSCLNVV